MNNGNHRNEELQPSRPMEMPAVRTTIVGGRPPGCGKPLGDIPRGIEVLVKKASVDPAFRAVLLARRAKAADEIGLRLTPEETLILDHVLAAQLEAIIARTSVDASRRNAFLGRAAGVMLAALGVSTSGCDYAVYSAGVRPRDANDMPAVTAPAEQTPSRPATLPAPQGIRQDAPRSAGETGVRPDSVRMAGEGAEVAGAAPEVTEMAGFMADRPASAPASAPASRPASRPASQPASRPALSDKEIDDLIRQLDDDRYTVREAAHKRLMEQGVSLLPRLRELLLDKDLSSEVRTRVESIAFALAATTQPARPKPPDRRETIIMLGIMPAD